MTDMTEEDIARQKAAIDAMGNAKKHMSVALDRIAFLETALKNAADALARMKQFIGSGCYPYESRKTLHQVIDDEVAEARRKLG